MKVRARKSFLVVYAAPVLTLLLLWVLPAVFPNRTIVNATALAQGVDRSAVQDEYGQRFVVVAD